MLKIFSRMHWHREAERVVEMKLSRQGCVLSSLMFTLKHIMELDNDVGTDGELHPPQRRQLMVIRGHAALGSIHLHSHFSRDLNSVSSLRGQRHFPYRQLSLSAY
jgi:hypothetical protein